MANISYNPQNFSGKIPRMKEEIVEISPKNQSISWKGPAPVTNTDRQKSEFQIDFRLAECLANSGGVCRITSSIFDESKFTRFQYVFR